jgi:23S rRNA (adenine2503-C2)-methyltransferase
MNISLVISLLFALVPIETAAFLAFKSYPSTVGPSPEVLYSTLSPIISQVDTEQDDAPVVGGLSMTVDELADKLGGRGRALIAWDCYSIGIDPALLFGSVISPGIDDAGIDDFETVSRLRPTGRRSQTLGTDALQKLAELYPNAGGQVEGGVASLSHISQSSDSTTKLLLRLADGLEVETVIIPWKGDRSTLCISSQVGCRQGCTFCATGRMGKLRSLTSDEILAQMFFARKICRLYDLPAVSNVVFMGMGEPADNADSVIKAVEILTTRQLFQLSATKITVSTVAPTPDSFRQFAKAPCALAWSVHAANDELRRKLVPTTKHTMVELRQGLIDALLDRPHNFRTTMLEIALMAGVNDSEKEADELAEFARVITDTVPGCKLIVNLIPFNDIGQTLYQTPKKEAVEAFMRRLWGCGVHAHIRVQRGDDESAACGQLATKKQILQKTPPKVEPL